MAHGACACLGGLNERPPNASPLKGCLNMPAFDECDRRRLTTWCVLPEIQFQESDDSSVRLRHKDDWGLKSILEVLSCLDVMIRKRTWPERLTQPNPVRPVTFNDFSDRHL